MLKKKPSEKCHRERLDDPVDEKRDHQSLGSLADVQDRGEVDLEHHRVDHQPDQYCDRNVDMTPLAEFHGPYDVDGIGEQFARKNPRTHAECHP
jgi:hypothetical protein